MSFRELTYWFMGINMVASALFTLIALVFGARDLRALIADLRSAEVDDTDDGRVTGD